MIKLNVCISCIPCYIPDSILKKTLDIKRQNESRSIIFYDLDTLYIILSMSPDNLKGYKIKKFNDND